MDNVFLKKVKGDKNCVELAHKLEKYRLQYVLVKSDDYLPADMKQTALDNLNKALADVRQSLTNEMKKFA